MFAEIRKRLVLFNTGLTALTLICLLVVSYIGLQWVFYHQEEQETIQYTNEEAGEHTSLLKTSPFSDKDDSISSGEKIFSYVYDRHHRLRSVTEPDKEIRSAVNQIIRTWDLPPGRVGRYRVTTSQGRSIIMLSSREIYDDGGLLGIVYAGKDITAYHIILTRYLLISCFIGLGFLILIYWIGNVMANKAMVPIYKSLEQQRQFMADASHELRTPLTVLFSGTEAVIGDEESKMSVFVNQTLADMKDEIQRLNKIVANLLILARADEGVPEIFKESVDIVRLVHEVTHSLSTLAFKKNIEIRFELPERLVVFADKERMYQLMYILLDNAIKYTPPEGKVFIAVSIIDDEVKIVVRDNGIGIAPEDQERIFERFYRIDKSRSREQGGTGLGLAIAKWIVSAHHGSIDVKSTLGKGTTFEIKINHHP